jgi:tetratricopeptide (TPR) repeat protein
VKEITSPSVLLRLLVPLAIIPLLGLSPLPHSVYSALQKVRNALNVDSPLNASAHIPIILEFFPDRADLWELTGHYAFLGGETELAVTYFQHAATFNSLSRSGFSEFGDAARQNGDLTTAIEAWQSAIIMGDPSVELYTRLLDAHNLQGDYDAIATDLYSLTKLEPTNPNHFYKLGIILTSKQPESALAYLLQAVELEPAYKDEVQFIITAIDGARRYDDPAYSLLESGRALANLNHWELAARAFQETIQYRPDYAEAWAYLGEARQHLEVSEEHQEKSNAGLTELEHALELDPRSIAANTFMALYWQRQGSYDLALVYLHEAATIEPDNPTIKAEIGRTLAIMGDLEKAKGYYEQATKLAPNDPHFWLQLAGFSTKYEYQLRETGLSAVRNAILLNPEDPASLDMMGEIFILLGDLSSAVRFFHRAIKADPDYAPAHLHLGFAYVLQGEDDLARKHLTSASTSSTKDSATTEQAQRMLDTYFP